MSRIGKQPIALPKGVEVKVSYARLEVKGPKGVLGVPIDPDLGTRGPGSLGLEVACRQPPACPRRLALQGP